MDLTRFKLAQQRTFDVALSEIKNGRKQSHWMWYIFPQIEGLGRSETAKYYSIHGIEEAKAFLADTYLKNHLMEISEALLLLEETDAIKIFGRTDSLKLRSSMTLFMIAEPTESVFQKVLDKYYGGKTDQRTIKLLKEKNMGKKITSITLVLILLSISLMGKTITTNAGETFAQATTMKLNGKFSCYISEGYKDGNGPQYYKVKVKKAGTLTMSINSKLTNLTTEIFNKNGKAQYCIKKVKVKQGQGWIGDDGSAVFLKSSVTNRMKGTITCKLKKGTYYFRFRDLHTLWEREKLTVKCKFKKKK